MIKVHLFIIALMFLSGCNSTSDGNAQENYSRSIRIPDSEAMRVLEDLFVENQINFAKRADGSLAYSRSQFALVRRLERAANPYYKKWCCVEVFTNTLESETFISELRSKEISYKLLQGSDGLINVKWERKDENEVDKIAQDLLGSIL